MGSGTLAGDGWKCGRGIRWQAGGRGGASAPSRAAARQSDAPDHPAKVTGLWRPSYATTHPGKNATTPGPRLFRTPSPDIYAITEKAGRLLPEALRHERIVHMFEGAADCDLVILAAADFDLESRYLADPSPDPWVRGEKELELIAACERQIAFLHAMQFRALSRFATLRPGANDQLVSEFAADEIALAAGWSRAVAGMRLNEAFSLTRRLTGTLQALEQGEIDLRRAQRLTELTDPLPVEVARQVEEEVLPAAAGQHPNELARATRKAIVRLDPDGAQDRHTARKRDRRVQLLPAEDAMAELRAYLPAPDAIRIYRRLGHFAHAAAPGDDRTTDQLRADIFTDLLLGHPTTASGPGGGTNTSRSAGNEGASRTGGSTQNGGSGRNNGVVVQVTVPATTLMGIDDQPGELAGYGPIPAAVARDIAAGGTWKRLLT